MKKLLFFITLVILFSCEKEERDGPRCWTCEIFKTAYDYLPQTGDTLNTRKYYDVEAVCDFDEAGIRKYEIARSDTTYPSKSYNKWEVIVKITKCE